MTNAQRTKEREIIENFANSVVPFLRMLNLQPRLVNLEYKKLKTGFRIYLK